MDKSRRKELMEQYKQMKSAMGIFIVRCKVNNKCYIQTTQDLKGLMNRTQVQLMAGLHKNKELQKEWNDLGSDNFTIEILENLKYDKDETKTDYSEELKVMQFIWEEKLIQQNNEFYNKRL